MATVPFSFECDRASGFVMDPNAHRRVGYITTLDGFGLAHPLSPDIKVNSPWSGANAPSYAGFTTSSGAPTAPVGTVDVVGVIEKWEWDGSVGGSINIDFYCSQQNATQIKMLEQLGLKTTNVKALGWWICDYDLEAKQWFEEAYPKNAKSVSGIIAGKGNPELNVDLTPVLVKDGIEVSVYKVSIAVLPGANQQYALHFANSSTTSIVKSWGLTIGSLASGSLKPTV
jgi:hypothetical protein